MSQEVAILAIIRPAPGKLDRLKQLLVDGIAWIEANEPGTLEFSIYENSSDEGVTISMFERYASRAALEKHQSSDQFREFFELMTNEELLADPPTIVSGNIFHSLQR